MLWEAFEYVTSKYTSSRTEAVLAQQCYDARTPLNVKVSVWPDGEIRW